MAKKGNSISKSAMWVLMGLLILGLGGFGATNLTGTVNSLGTVGDKKIDINAYARQLQQEIARVQQSTGETLPFARVREIGLDQAVLQRIVTERALDHEADVMGISVGDENLRDQILQIPAFQGLNGEFDREGYTFALQSSGLSENEFEISLREETARTLLQGALVSGVQMPDTYAETLVSFLGEQRDFTWARLGAAALDAPIPAPTPEQLRAYYDENPEEFMNPDIKRITYAVLSPDDLVPTIDIPEDQLRAEYEARASEFNAPERRLVERLAYLDEEAATQAMASLEAGGATFETLVADRGLTLEDVDLGDVQRLELGSAGEEVFGAEVGDVVGPLPSDLGPAIFRINAVLPAQSTSFEDARPLLQDALAADRARRLIETQAEGYDDMLAGGATLEELAEETEMELGTIDWSDGNGEGIGAFVAFAEAARAVNTSDFPAITQLEDGGIFALRLDSEIPSQVAPFEDVENRVRANWENAQTEAALRTQAEALLPQLTSGTDFAGAGLDATVETDQRRSSFIAGTPPAFMTDVFDMNVGDVQIIDGFGSVLVVRLDGISEASDDPDAVALQAQLAQQIDQALARDVFNVYATDTVLRAGQYIDQRALQAVHVNFP